MNDIIIQKQAPELTFDQAKQAWINALLAKVSYAPIYKKIAEIQNNPQKSSLSHKEILQDAFKDALADKEEVNLTNDEIQYIANHYTLIDATGSI